MSTITRERVAQFINNPLDNGLTRGEQMELARIALASLEAEPVTEWTNEQCLEFLSIAFRHAKIKGDLELDDIRLGVKMVNDSRAAMLQGAEQQNRQQNIPENIPTLRDGLAAIRSLGEIDSGKIQAERDSLNSPAIPDEVLSAVRRVASIRSDFNDFDGDRRGIGDCLDEAEQELIVTINKYASAIAAAPQQEVK